MSFGREDARKRRHKRIRKQITGTTERPRLCVRKSLKHMSVQLIDDTKGQTLLGLSTYSPKLSGEVKRGNKEGAKELGKLVAAAAKAQKIESVVFDRGGHLYHGRVRALAESLRESGLKF